MHTVEKNIIQASVRWGFGHTRYHDAFRQLGCADFLTPKQVEEMKSLGAPCPLRPDADDIAVMMRPSEFAPIVLKWLASSKCVFEVPGHEPRRLLTHADRETFRALKGSVRGVQVLDGRGAKPLHKVTPEHLQEALADWHAGEQRGDKWVPLYSLKEIEERMATRTGLKGDDAIKAHWVRDQVKKKFDTAARKPPSKEQSDGR